MKKQSPLKSIKRHYEIKRDRKDGGYKVVYSDGSVDRCHFPNKASAIAMMTGNRDSQCESDI